MDIMMLLSILGAKVVMNLGSKDDELVNECDSCPIEDCPIKDVMVSDYYGDQRQFDPDYPDICTLD